MNSGYKLIFLALIVLSAESNNPVFSRSEKTISLHLKNDIQNVSSSKTANSRILIKFPLPEYTIADSGVVVVVVRINKNGRIINAKIDKAKSTTNNKMLYNNALKAANYAKYNQIDKDTVETGQLTYRFKLK